MDYLGWELARQRTALAALLGGGEAREGRDTRKGERRSPAEPGAALGGALRQAGRYAGGAGDIEGPAGGAKGAWEAVWTAGTDRLPQAAEGPVSAWKEPAVGGRAPEGEGRNAETGVPAGPSRMEREETPGGGTGAGAEFSRPSGGYAARRRARRAEAASETAAVTLAEPAAEVSGRIAAGEWRAGRGDSGGEALPGAEPGDGASAGPPEREGGVRRGTSYPPAGFLRESRGGAEA